MSCKGKDPVCGMLLDAYAIEIVYAGIHCGFCSNRCYERFVDHPHIYIGYPGHKSPKQRGEKVIKCRYFRLEHLLSPKESEFLSEELQKL